MKIHGTHSGQPAPSHEAPESSTSSGSTSGHPSGQDPSKPSTSLNSLPADLQLKIGSLLLGSPHEAVRDMTVFRATSRVQYDSLFQDGSPWHLAQELAPLVPVVDRCFREFLIEDGGVVSQAHLFGPALGFLSPRQRAGLVRLVHRLPDDFDRSVVIESLGRELVHLKVSQRSHLVTAALTLVGDHRAYAMSGLVASLAHLAPSQRKDVLERAINMPNAILAKSKVLAKLASNLSQLYDTERDSLVRAAIHLPQDSASVIAALGPRLTFLNEARRHDLVQTAVALPMAPGERARALGQLFRGLAGLSAAQRKMLIDAAVAALGANDADFGQVIIGLRPAVGYLNKAQRDGLFHRAINLEQPVIARALHGLGMCVSHLDEAQREELLRKTRSMPSAMKASAVAGMAAGGAVHLGEYWRNTLVAEVTGIEDSPAKHQAIGHFGEGLEHLSTADQRALIAAATGSTSITGLAKGLRHLAQPERQLLVDAAERLGNLHERAAAVVAIAKATSEAQLLREPGIRGS